MGVPYVQRIAMEIVDKCYREYLLVWQANAVSDFSEGNIFIYQKMIGPQHFLLECKIFQWNVEHVFKCASQYCAGQVKQKGGVHQGRFQFYIIFQVLKDTYQCGIIYRALDIFRGGVLAEVVAEDSHAAAAQEAFSLVFNQSAFLDNVQQLLDSDISGTVTLIEWFALIADSFAQQASEFREFPYKCPHATRYNVDMKAADLYPWNNGNSVHLLRQVKQADLTPYHVKVASPVNIGHHGIGLVEMKGQDMPRRIGREQNVSFGQHFVVPDGKIPYFDILAEHVAIRVLLEILTGKGNHGIVEIVRDQLQRGKILVIAFYQKYFSFGRGFDGILVIHKTYTIKTECQYIILI